MTTLSATSLPLILSFSFIIYYLAGLDEIAVVFSTNLIKKNDFYMLDLHNQGMCKFKSNKAPREILNSKMTSPCIINQYFERFYFHYNWYFQDMHSPSKTLKNFIKILVFKFCCYLFKILVKKVGYFQFYFVCGKENIWSCFTFKNNLLDIKQNFLIFHSLVKTKSVYFYVQNIS